MTAAKKLKSNLFGVRRQASIVAFAALCACGIQACSSDDNPKPTDTTPVLTGGTGGSVSSTGGSTASGGASAGSTASGGSSAGGAAGDAGSGNIAGTAGAAGGPPVSACETTTGTNGCFICPKQNIQFLNQCNDKYCSPFANKDRLPKLNPDGSLPELPK